MRLKFSKMHGLGNDFMVIDGINQPLTLTAEQIRQLGDRHFGVGFDQLLLVEAAREPGNDFRYRIFNNDGNEVGQCGNGARCFARFVSEQGLTQQTRLRVETAQGVIVPELLADGQVRVDMGTPRLAPEQIPFVADHQAIIYPLQIGGEAWPITVVSMGNPHAVIVVGDCQRAEVERLGPLLQHDPHFPQQVNVGFMQYLSRYEINLRVYERGAGETLACGSGACAAVVVGILRQQLDARVKVNTHGGSMTIEWPGAGQSVMLTGPATTVFYGEINV